MKLLLVEDDPWTNVVMNIVLRETRFVKQHKIKTNGQEAIDYLEECSSSKNFPDLVLVDLKMPVMNGVEFIDNYERKYSSKFPKSKLVVISNHQEELERVRNKKFNSVKACIMKPLTTSVLKELKDKV